jgi:aspartate/methionine/tyrosine aminotransferase
LSKSIGLPQVKLAWLGAGGPATLIEDALKRIELAADTYLTVSTPVQVAAPELLRQGANVRRQIQVRIRTNYEALQSAVAAVSSCRVLDADGGWYGVIQVPSIQDEEDLVVDLVTRDGVLAHPGYFFDFERPSYLVVSLLCPEVEFREGIDRVLSRFDAAPSAG